VLFHVVKSTCNPLTVTAEVASSSLVVPAILFASVYAAFLHFWRNAMVPAIDCRDVTIVHPSQVAQGLTTGTERSSKCDVFRVASVA
jgi:hypothetical protein